MHSKSLQIHLLEIIHIISQCLWVKCTGIVQLQLLLRVTRIQSRCPPGFIPTWQVDGDKFIPSLLRFPYSSRSERSGFLPVVSRVFPQLLEPAGQFLARWVFTIRLPTLSSHQGESYDYRNDTASLSYSVGYKQLRGPSHTLGDYKVVNTKRQRLLRPTLQFTPFTIVSSNSTPGCVYNSRSQKTSQPQLNNGSFRFGGSLGFIAMAQLQLEDSHR